MTSDAYRIERQCPSTRADGQPCGNFRVWGETQCAAHLGRLPRRLSKAQGDAVVKYRAAVPTCRCDALPHPHRPGGAPCRWPEGFDDPEAALTPRVRPAKRVTHSDLLRQMRF